MILIADSGSTKTDWLIIAGQSSFFVKTTGLNPYFQTLQQVTSILTTELLPQLNQAVHFEAIYYYGTGITDDNKRNVLKQALTTTFGQTSIIEIESDMLGAARALFQSQSGIACILGTGSNSAFYNGNIINFQVPTWGFWLGDEGSGGHLGKTLVLAYVHDELPESLKKAFESKFGVILRSDLLETAYRKPFPNRYFASFTPFLSENQHDAFVQQLIRSAFSLFFEKYLCKYPNFSSTSIGFVGSVAFHFKHEISSVAKAFGHTNTLIFESKPIEMLGIYHSTIIEM